MNRVYTLFAANGVTIDTCKTKGDFIDVAKYKSIQTCFGIDKLFGMIKKCKTTFTQFFFAIDYPDVDFDEVMQIYYERKAIKQNKKK